jgi:HAD superfamily hydrolase (TIGR01509 family)
MQERLDLATPLEDIIEEVRGGVIRRIEARLPILPGALDAVHLAAAHYPVALASGSPTLVINTMMTLTGLNEVFQTMVYGDDMAHGKPAPDIYLEAARRLGVAPAHCVGIEDSVNGLRSLKAAGMKAIAVPSPGFTLPQEALVLADRHLETLEGMTLELLRELA